MNDSKHFTTSNCDKARQLNVIRKQIAKFITITSNKNIKCLGSRPI